MRTAKQLLKKKTLVVGILLTTLFSQNSLAMIIGPILDPTNTAENILKQVSDIETRLKDEVISAAKRELKKEMKKAAGLADADRQSSKLVSEQRLEKNLRNHEVASQNTPTPGLCNNVYHVDKNGDTQSSGRSKTSILTFSMRGEMFCNALLETKAEKQKSMVKLGLPKGSPSSDDESVLDEELRLLDALLLSEEEDGDEINIDDMLPHKLTGLTHAEYNLAIDKARIMLPPMQDANKIERISDLEYTKDLSKSMRSMFPYQTQVDQITDKLRPSADMYSERESQDMFAADFMDVENIESYTFRNMMTPSQVEREKAMMTAFLVHMAIQHYKSSIDKEMLLSVKLVERVPN